jgi:hypothetical protein
MRINRKQWEWIIIGILGLLALGLAFVGFQIHFQREGVERNGLDILFQSIKIFSAEFVDGFQSPLPWQLEIARWLAPLVFLYAAAKAVIFLLRRELRGFRARFYRKHVIVAGLHHQSRPLIEELLEKGEKVIVMTGRPIDDWDPLEAQGALFIPAQLQDQAILKRTNARRARYLILMNEEDGQNLSQALFLKKALRPSPYPKPTIFVHAASELRLEEWVSLGFFEPPSPQSPAKQECELRLFSIAQRSARILVNELGPDCLSPIQAEDPPTRIALVGNGPLAQSLVLRLARLGHYPHLHKLKLYWWLEEDTPLKELLQAFPGLKEVVELHPFVLPFRLFDAEALQAAGKPLHGLYLLCERETETLSILSKLRNPKSGDSLPVVLAASQEKGKLNPSDLPKLAGLRLYQVNLQEKSLSREALLQEPLDELARHIHQAYLQSLSERNSQKNTHQDWPYLTIDARDQNREQADHLYIKLRTLGLEAVPLAEADQKQSQLQLSPDQLERLAEMEHNRWWASKLLGGWTYAPEESKQAMTHPDLVPYEQLSEPIKDYDRDAVKNLPQLLRQSGLGWKVRKDQAHA